MYRHKETSRLKAMVAAGARISWKIPHARLRAVERQIPIYEAERIIKSGMVTGLEIEADGQERWRVSGRADGRPVDVVVLPIGDHTLRVLTVIRTDE